LGFRSGATPFGHVHPNTAPQRPRLKEDISIWQERGHFYLALTYRSQTACISPIPTFCCECSGTGNTASRTPEISIQT
jgi:hypothetical protein